MIRTGASMLANGWCSTLELKSYGGRKSDAVAQQYLDQSHLSLKRRSAMLDIRCEESRLSLVEHGSMSPRVAIIHAYFECT